jgi:diguanylate cyclase (GGDEF)-like protein
LYRVPLFKSLIYPATTQRVNRLHLDIIFISDHFMKALRQTVINYLEEFSGNDEMFIHQFHSLVQEEGNEACSVLFKILTHIDFSPPKAEEYWQRIISHRENMSKLLSREVNLRAIICDYFCSVDGSLENPKMIEIQLYEEKEKIIKYDNLTGLHNRAYYNEILEKEIARGVRRNLDFSVVFFDVDNFKGINDTYGHLTGDRILKQTAEVVKGAQRKEDVAARFGGDEFVMLLPDTTKVQALVLAERIRQYIEELAFVQEEKTFGITITGGIAAFPEDGTDSLSLLNSADCALYQAKSLGKNDIVVFSENKRNFLRVDFFKEINIVEINETQAEPTIVTSKNLSKSGVLFQNESPFEIGRRIQLEIQVNNNIDMLKITGTVVRVEMYEPNRYDIGVSFLEVDSNTKNELTKYILQII